MRQTRVNSVKNKYNQHNFQNKSFNGFHSKKRLNDNDSYSENYKKNNTNNKEDYYERNLKKMKL